MSEQPRRRRRQQDAIVDCYDEVYDEMSTENTTFTNESIQREESIPPEGDLPAKISVVEATASGVDFAKRVDAKQAYISEFGLDRSNIEEYKKTYMNR